MGFSLTVLGCSPTFPTPDNPCSGYLLRSSQTAVLVDCGPGVFAALQRHQDPRELTALWLSHLHPDHCVDLLTVLNWTVNVADAPRLPVYGPAGWQRRVAAMLPQDDAESLVHQAFEVHEIYDSHTAHVGNLRMHSRAVRHSVPAFGVRIVHNGRTMAYSGDTGSCAELVELARNADLLVCEAGAAERQAFHCTPSEAGQVARDAGVRQLLLTHIARGIVESSAVDQAVWTAGCSVGAARPGMRIALSD